MEFCFGFDKGGGFQQIPQRIPEKEEEAFITTYKTDVMKRVVIGNSVVIPRQKQLQIYNGS